MLSPGEEPCQSCRARTDSTPFDDALVVQLSRTGSLVTADVRVSLLTLPALTTTFTPYSADLPFGIATDTRIAFGYSGANELDADFVEMENGPVNPRRVPPAFVQLSPGPSPILWTRAGSVRSDQNCGRNYSR